MTGVGRPRRPRHGAAKRNVDRWAGRPPARTVILGATPVSLTSADALWMICADGHRRVNLRWMLDMSSLRFTATFAPCLEQERATTRLCVP